MIINANTILALLLLGSLFVVPGHTEAVDSENNPTSLQPLNGSFTSVDGIQYNVTIRPKVGRVSVTVSNPTGEQQNHSGFVILVDDERFNKTNLKLSPNESWSNTWKIHDYVNVLRENHSVVVSSFGGHTTLNFTKRVDYEHPGKYSVPTIVETELVAANESDYANAYLAVTMSNPSRRSYAMRLMVHTNETNGKSWGAMVPYKKDQYTVYVPLRDDADHLIQGEVRLYYSESEGVNATDGVRQQVSFEGRVGGETRMRNESYEPVVPPFEEEPYVYGPDSSGTGPIPVPRLLSASAMALGVVVGVTLVIVLVFRLRG
jgi:hypothetical protein